MKFLFDLLPLLVFFGMFRVARWLPDASTALVTGWVGALDGTPEQQAELCAFILATLSTILATVVQISVLLARRQPVKPAVWISAVVVLVFGGLTIWFHNEWFLKWKPSILYWIFAGVLLGGKWIMRRNFLGSLITQEMELTLPARVEDSILYAWSLFFLALGAVNLYVAYAWSTEAWVNFKTFGAMGLILAFSVGTGVFLARYLPPPTKATEK